jgi:hypothetical protein
MSEEQERKLDGFEKFDEWFKEFKKKPIGIFLKKMLPIIVVMMVIVILNIAIKTTNRGGMVHNFINEPDRAAARYEKAEAKKQEARDYADKFKADHYPKWLTNSLDRIFYRD